MGLSQNGIQLLWHVANWENDSLNHWDFGVEYGVPKFLRQPHVYTYLVVPFLWPTARHIHNTKPTKKYHFIDFM